MPETITLQGTPPQLGEQIAIKLLGQPIGFAFEQLPPKDFDLFCIALMGAAAGLMANKISPERVTDITAMLATVVSEAANAPKGPLQ